MGRSAQGEATGLAWSPDGRYLVWRQARDGEDSCGAIFCWDEHGLGESFQLTKGTFDDSNPVFTADGKYLVVLSARTFDPHYDGQTFDLSFGHTIRPWLAPLSASEPSPFGPVPEGWRISEVQDAKAKALANAAGDLDHAPTVTCELDSDGSVSYTHLTLPTNREG